MSKVSITKQVYVPQLLIPGKKPVGPVEIDWTKKAATNGLKHMWLATNKHKNVFYDFAQKRKHGSLENGGSFQPQSGRYGLRLDGDTEYVSLPNIDTLDGVSAFTVSFWVYKEDLGNFGEYDGVVALGPSGARCPWIWGDVDRKYIRMYFHTESDVADLHTENIPVKIWTHIALTWDGTTARSYQNGIEIETDTTTGNTLVDNAGGNAIGYMSGFGNWHGSLDDVRIYNKTLSTAEINSLIRNPYNILKPLGPDLDAFYFPVSVGFRPKHSPLYGPFSGPFGGPL